MQGIKAMRFETGKTDFPRDGSMLYLGSEHLTTSGSSGGVDTFFPSALFDRHSRPPLSIPPSLQSQANPIYYSRRYLHTET